MSLYKVRLFINRVSKKKTANYCCFGQDFKFFVCNSDFMALQIENKKLFLEL